MEKRFEICENILAVAVSECTRNNWKQGELCFDRILGQVSECWELAARGEFPPAALIDDAYGALCTVMSEVRANRGKLSIAVWSLLRGAKKTLNQEATRAYAREARQAARVARSRERREAARAKAEVAEV